MLHAQRIGNVISQIVASPTPDTHPDPTVLNVSLEPGASWVLVPNDTKPDATTSDDGATWVNPAPTVAMIAVQDLFFRLPQVKRKQIRTALAIDDDIAEIVELVKMREEIDLLGSLAAALAAVIVAKGILTQPQADAWLQP